MDDKSEMPIRPKGKFKKMFPGLKAWSIEGIDWQKFLALYVKFQPDNEMDKGLPAGYTYLGQFISHDLSLDITPLQTFETNAENVDNYRTAAFDLDSVYEYSPASYPAMYDKDRASFLLQNVTITDGNQDFWDMPRDNNRHAIIPDKRNDENIIVSQLHIAFQCLHNKFVKDQKGAKDAYYRFATARNMVIKYYQWIILYDFLGKILGKTKEEIQDLVTSIRSSRRRNGSDAKPGRMPVEFSASAFRFGHSLVREIYLFNHLQNKATLFPDPRREMKNIFVDWSLFFPSDSETPDPDLNIANLIDMIFSPAFKTGGDINTLLVSDLKRSARMGIASGQLIAEKLGLNPLTKVDWLTIGSLLGLKNIFDDSQEGADPLKFMDSAPLTYYILADSLVNGKGNRLGELGGRIIAETIIGLLLDDKNSILNRNFYWRPKDINRISKEHFTIVDLFKLAGVYHGALVHPPPSQRP